MNNKPLYCFMLSEKTGEIKRYEIKEYEDLKNKYRWYRPDGYRKYTYKRNLDKVYHNEIDSFNGDLSHALKIYESTFMAKRDKANEDYWRFHNLLVRIAIKQYE